MRYLDTLDSVFGIGAEDARFASFTPVSSRSAASAGEVEAPSAVHEAVNAVLDSLMASGAARQSLPDVGAGLRSEDDARFAPDAPVGGLDQA